MQGFIKHLSFQKRDFPIPADYRPLFKIGHLIIILAICCRGNKSSLMKLHFLCWAIKNKRNSVTVQEWVKNNFKSDFHVWGIEPTVNRALIFASADGIITDEGSHFILTQKGIDFFKIIMSDEELFANEKSFLKAIGKSIITEQRITELSSKFY